MHAESIAMLPPFGPIEGQKWFDQIQPMRVPEKPVCIYLFRQNPVFTSLHLQYPVHVVPSLNGRVERAVHLVTILLVIMY
jgi:hypothetical protein